MVVSCNTSHEIWVTLSRYYNKPSYSHLFELLRKLQTVAKQNKSISDYLTEIKLICDQLASIGSPVPERMKIFSALQGLDKEYEPLITSIEGSVDLITNPLLDGLIPRLQSYDSRIQSYKVEVRVYPHLAFNTTRASQGYYNALGRGQNNRRFRSARGRGSFSVRGRGFHQQLSSSSASFVSSDDRPSCQICGRFGHSALRCLHRFNNSYQDEELPMALTTMRVIDVTEQSGAEWFLDSGASSHVTNSMQHLNHNHPYRGNDAVLIGDGSFLPITHVGSADLASTSGTLPLRDVLVCPDITKSLLSVSKLTKDYPCSFDFDSDGVCIKDKGSRKVLNRGNTSEGLYRLQSSSPQVFNSNR